MPWVLEWRVTRQPAFTSRGRGVVNHSADALRTPKLDGISLATAHDHSITARKKTTIPELPNKYVSVSSTSFPSSGARAVWRSLVGPAARALDKLAARWVADEDRIPLAICCHAWSGWFIPTCRNTRVCPGVGQGMGSGVLMGERSALGGEADSPKSEPPSSQPSRLVGSPHNSSTLTISSSSLALPQPPID